MALQLRRKTHESIVYIDSDSAPRIMPSGEDFILEDLPVGTRVLYPNPPIKGLPNREAAIRYALNHPLDCDPLFAQLEPGMKVTIAVDDISLPLPPMATPDIRQTMLEIVLDMLAGHGVDDVHIIIANSLHRKMTAWEMKRMVGQKIFDEYYSDRYMDPARSELSNKCGRLGKIVDEHLNVFHIETSINNRMYKSDMDFLLKNEDDFSAFDRMKFEAMRYTMSKMPRTARRKLLHSRPAQYELTACYAGKTEPVHEKILEKGFQQYAIPVRGQCDILITGIPDISPYNVYSILNPLLVQVMGLGYHFNFYRNKPLLKKGGVLIIHHPCYDEFDHNFHPSYIEFFNRLLPESRDAFYLREKYEREFANNPSYIEMYRRGNAYHGAHPFFMWYWGENGRQHVGKVIAAGAENAHVPAMLGWERADNLTEAIAMARSYIGSSAEITMLHQPMFGIADME